MAMAIENYINGRGLDDAIITRPSSLKKDLSHSAKGSGTGLGGAKKNKSVFANKAKYKQLQEERKAQAEWTKDCRIWMYRGAWDEWDVADIDMCVPMSPEELREKRNAILKHQSQMESAPFLGNDERLFWQRAEDRNRATAELYDDLGLACYEAMEAFVEYKFQ